MNHRNKKRNRPLLWRQCSSAPCPSLLSFFFRHASWFTRMRRKTFPLSFFFAWSFSVWTLGRYVRLSLFFRTLAHGLFFPHHHQRAPLFWVCLCAQTARCTSQCLERDIESPYGRVQRSPRQNATRMPRHGAGACHGAVGVSHAAAARARSPCSQGRAWSRAPWPLPHRHACGGGTAHAQRRRALWRRRVAHVDVHHLAGAHNGPHHLPSPLSFVFSVSFAPLVCGRLSFSRVPRARIAPSSVTIFSCRFFFPLWV